MVKNLSHVGWIIMLIVAKQVKAKYGTQWFSTTAVTKTFLPTQSGSALQGTEAETAGG